MTFLKKPLLILDVCASVLEKSAKKKIEVKSSTFLEATNVLPVSNILQCCLEFNCSNNGSQYVFFDNWQKRQTWSKSNKSRVHKSRRHLVSMILFTSGTIFHVKNFYTGKLERIVSANAIIHIVQCIVD